MKTPTQAELHLDDRNIDDVLTGSPTPVLVDFSAAWCPPCRAMAPAIAQLAQEYEGRFVVGTLDVDESPSTAERFGISSMPTLLVIKGGQVVEKTVGARSLAALRELLDRHLQG